MTGRINDNVLTLFSLEPNLRGVDGDVLIALGLQRIHQVRPFEGDTAPFGNLLKLLQFAFGQRAGVMEEAADKSGFTVVHMADDHDFELLAGSGGR